MLTNVTIESQSPLSTVIPVKIQCTRIIHLYDPLRTHYSPTSHIPRHLDCAARSSESKESVVEHYFLEDNDVDRKQSNTGMSQTYATDMPQTCHKHATIMPQTYVTNMPCTNIYNKHANAVQSDFKLRSSRSSSLLFNKKSIKKRIHVGATKIELFKKN